jgi:hypothetical protein
MKASLVRRSLVVLVAAATACGGSGGGEVPSPIARGLIDPPVVVGGGVPCGYASGDAQLGLLYWRSTHGSFQTLMRTELGGEPELVYEAAENIEVLGVGPDAVYFLREDAGRIGRLTHDLAELNLDWATVTADDAANLDAGFVGTRHLYGSKVRVALATGVVEPSPFSDFAVNRDCALNPERTRAACTTGVFDLLDDVVVRPMDGYLQLSNGSHAADDTAFFFTPQFSGGPVYRLDYATLDQPKRLIDLPEEALSAAASGNRLYIGLATTIVALDATTGETIRTVGLPHAPNATMYVWKGFLYYGTFSGDLQRAALSTFEP